MYPDNIVGFHEAYNDIYTLICECFHFICKHITKNSNKTRNVIICKILKFLKIEVEFIRHKTQY